MEEQSRTLGRVRREAVDVRVAGAVEEDGVLLSELGKDHPLRWLSDQFDPATIGCRHLIPHVVDVVDGPPSGFGSQWSSISDIAAV